MTLRTGQKLTFDPGDGWRMEQFDGEVPTGAVAFHEEDGSWTYWVCNPPALPTEPWTVFRTTHESGVTATWLRHSNGTLLAVHSGEFWDEDPKDFTLFEVLAEPIESEGND